MNGAKPWKLVLLLAGIFVAGGVVGSALTLHLGHRWLQRRAAPEQWGPARLKTLARHLDLSREQIEQLRPVVHRNMTELAQVRQQGFEESRQILQRMEQEISAVLTPDQRVKFEEMNAEFRERARRALEQRRKERLEGRPGERGGRPPPPPDRERKGDN